MTARLCSDIAGFSARRARPLLAAAVVVAIAAVALALRLHATAATGTFVSSHSSTYRQTQRFYDSFGEEPVVVLVRGDLQQLLLSSDVDRLAGLEGCLSGKVPASDLPREGGVGGPCGQLARAGTVKVVLGPGSFLNAAANRIDEQLTLRTQRAEEQARQADAAVERAARARGLPAAQARALGQQAQRITMTRFQEGLVTLALQYGLTSRPSLEDPRFVSSVVFDSTRAAGTPKARFAYLFPSRSAALISVRMRSGLSEAQRTRTISLIRAAVAMGRWQLARGGSYYVTGVPVIASDLPAAIGRSIALLMVAVLALMAAALGLIFRGRPRLLPLALAVIATALAFAGLSLAGASLTMASIAVLPVLIGLAVDYAIQFQSRAAEAIADDRAGERSARPDRTGAGARADPSQRRAELVARAAAAGAPTLLTAGAASGAATLVLLLSPVPMVRGFGVLLVAGMAIALALALTLGSAAIALSASRDRGLASHARRPAPPWAGALAASWRGAGELLLENPLTRAVRDAALVLAVRHPARVLCAGLVLAAAGWALDTQTRVETDITKLVPQSMGSLRNLDQLERSSGVAGEIDLMVRAGDVAAPRTLEWMSSYEAAVLRHAGYSPSRGCGRAPLCPAFSLPDLLRGASPPGVAPAAATGARPQAAGELTRAAVDALLAVIPPYLSQYVLTSDRRVATLAFGIRVMSLQAQQALIDAMRARLHPPAGVSASIVGLPVLAAQSGSQVADPWRRLLTLLVGLAAVAAVLLAAFRGDRRRALTPLVPIVLATGWSALVLFAVRVPLNPMSVTLGALVIAISTEFSVLLSERHRQERLAGRDSAQALRRSYERTGAAVAASGVTAIAGFGVLALSDIRMLRDFGLVTLIDLSVSLLGVLVALPAVIAIAEREQQPLGRVLSLAPASLLKLARRRTLRAGRRPAGRRGSEHEPA